MKTSLLLTCLLVACAASSAHADETKVPTLTPMPAALESRLALSALPPALREDATVYLLDPASGYRIAHEGGNHLTCLVERTAWELAEFRDDIYIPLCYDAAGTRTYLKAIMDTAALRAKGMEPQRVKATIEAGFHDGTYVPDRAGLSYMLAPVMRTVGPPDMKIHTMAMPHLMFYAPGLTNADIGAKPDFTDPSSLRYPFIDRQGIAEHSYIIQFVGEAEKATLLEDEQPLIDDLCSHRTVLCLAHAGHHAAQGRDP